VGEKHSRIYTSESGREMKTKAELIKALAKIPNNTEIQCSHSTAAIFAVGKNGVPKKVFCFIEEKPTHKEDLSNEWKAKGL